AVCVPDPQIGRCVQPFHDPHVINAGGPHSTYAERQDIHQGSMDGFIGQAKKGEHAFCRVLVFNPLCTAITGRHPDVMGYHDAREIPNYWTYARDFVLQDHLFESSPSWSLPAHLTMVSGWSARCSDPLNRWTCKPKWLSHDPESRERDGISYPWTDV